MNDYQSPQQLVTTLHDLEEVFKLMQRHSIAEVTIGELVIHARHMPPDLGTIAAKTQHHVTDEDILRNPYTGMQA